MLWIPLTPFKSIQALVTNSPNLSLKNFSSHRCPTAYGFKRYRLSVITEQTVTLSAKTGEGGHARSCRQTSARIAVSSDLQTNLIRSTRGRQATGCCWVLQGIDMRASSLQQGAAERLTGFQCVLSVCFFFVFAGTFQAVKQRLQPAEMFRHWKTK